MAANRKFIPEILDEINNDVSTIVNYKSNTALKILLEYAFLPEKKFVLPEGTPPYKKDAAPPGMSPSNFVQEFRRLYIFTAARDLHPVRRETLFVSLLEGLHPTEADVLIAVKDQTLGLKYPNITPTLLVDNGMLPESARALAIPKKPRGRPAKNSGS